MKPQPLCEPVWTIVETGTFERRKSGRVFGRIYLQVGEFFFPAKAWTDFPVILLGGWLHELLRPRDGTSSPRLSFMDGPYRFQFECRTEGVGLTAFKGAYLRDIVMREIPNVDFDAFLRSTAMQAQSCVEYIDLKGWANADSECLRKELTSARVLWARGRTSTLPHDQTRSELDP